MYLLASRSPRFIISIRQFQPHRKLHSTAIRSRRNMASTNGTNGSDEQPKMQYTNLGGSGLKVSKVIVGCMSFGSPDWQGW